jgi:translation initiation factor IF-3
MSYELTGKIKTISEVKQVSDSFKVREFVVTIDADGKYPQHIQLQASNDKCESLNAFTTGSDVKVAFNLRGREWTNPQGEVKTFNSLDAWRIEVAAADSAPGSVPNQVPTNQVPVNVAPPAMDGGDNLPF